MSKLVLRVDLSDDKVEDGRMMLEAGRKGYHTVVRPLDTDNTLFLSDDDDLSITSLKGYTSDNLEQSFKDAGYEVTDIHKW